MRPGYPVEMLRRGLPALFLIAVLCGAGIAGATTRPAKPIRAEAPIEGRQVVGDGRAQVLLFNQYFPTTTPAITRLGTNGKIDRSFGDGGTVARYANSIAVDARGRILLASDGYGGSPTEKKALLTRLLPDGRLDPSFGSGGYARIPGGSQFGEGWAVAVEADGDILLGGNRLAPDRGRKECVQVIRMKPDGSLDPTFGSGGVATRFCDSYEEVVLSVSPTPSGAVIVAVGNDIEVGVARLESDGSRDRHFGNRRGWFEMPFSRQTHGRKESLFPAPGAVVGPGGKVLLAATGEIYGVAERVVALRLKADGRLDRTYGEGGWAVSKGSHQSIGAEAGGPIMLPGGVLAVAATFGGTDHRGSGAVAFDSHGRPDPGFGHRGVCDAHLPGEHEAIGVADVGGRGLAVEGGPKGEVWLLRCEKAGA